MEQQNAEEMVRTEVRALVEATTEAPAPLAIQNDADYCVVGEHLKHCKGVLARINDVFDPIIKSANATHKAAIAQKKQVAAPAMKANLFLRDLAGKWESKQAAERRAEEARKRAELAAIEQAERDKRTDAAMELAAGGQLEEAKKEATAAMEFSMPAPTEKKPTRPAGISTVTRWKFEITDPAKVRAEYLIPDMVTIGKEVRRDGAEAVNRFGPGVRVYSEETPVVR